MLSWSRVLTSGQIRVFEKTVDGENEGEILLGCELIFLTDNVAISVCSVDIRLRDGDPIAYRGLLTQNEKQRSDIEQRRRRHHIW